MPSREEDNVPDADLAAIAERLDVVAELVRRIGDEVGTGINRGAEAAIERHRPEVYAAMEGLGQAINEFVGSRPPPDRLAAGQRLFVERLYSVSIASPTTSFAAHDKRHRPPYYELVKHVRAGRAGGADVAARVVDDYFVHSRLGEAYINWLNLVRLGLVDEATHWLSAHEHPLHFVSLQYIGGVDLLPLAPVIGQCGGCQLVCLDDSAEAVRDAEQQLKPAFGNRVRCQRADPIRWLAGPDCPPESACIIYAESLMQLLSDKRIARLLHVAHGALRPGGVLLLGASPSRTPVAEQQIREWLLMLDWQFRSENQLRALIARSPFGASSLDFQYEPLGLNALVRVEKATV